MAMIVSAFIIIGYTTTGGFLAASKTDFIQSIVMSIALIVVLIYGINRVGGIDQVIDNANNLPGILSLDFTHNNVSGGADPYGIFNKITISFIKFHVWQILFCSIYTVCILI